MTPTAGIAAVIQLAVAPVFLLAAIAGLLGVMSTRLGRIIDRARVIERRIHRPSATSSAHCCAAKPRRCGGASL